MDEMNLREDANEQRSSYMLRARSKEQEKEVDDSRYERMFMKQGIDSYDDDEQDVTEWEEDE